MFEDIFKLTKKNLDRHNSEINLNASELKEEYSKQDNNYNHDKSAKKTNSTCSSRSSNTNSKTQTIRAKILKIPVTAMI